MDDPESVAALVEGARRGDPRAWDQLVERFLPLVRALIARYRLPGAEADDVNQTVWLRLVEHLDDLREPRALPGWLSTTTRNECARAHERAGRTIPVDPQVDGKLDSPAEDRDLAEGLIALERQQALRAALAELPADRRQLLELLLEDPPPAYQEISSRLGIPIGSIGPTRARALRQLRGTRAVRRLLDEPPEERS
ncbi:sigma-70 family RNA polymerase sigma factor [Nocardioides sp. YIM 152588]|uniref:RNA polymerase sigma factor n=1 Tax=Nocardioides sp. YIM 152588 TaxID=3158259 RepID=UPI0032E3E7B4